MTCTLAVGELSTLSTEYVVNDVETSVADPTGFTVEYAFPAVDTAPSVWVSGGWETVTDPFKIRCLVGPSGVIALGAGTYDVWIRITGAPETVVRNTGELKVF